MENNRLELQRVALRMKEILKKKEKILQQKNSDHQELFQIIEKKFINTNKYQLLQNIEIMSQKKGEYLECKKKLEEEKNNFQDYLSNIIEGLYNLFVSIKSQKNNFKMEINKILVKSKL